MAGDSREDGIQIEVEGNAYTYYRVDSSEDLIVQYGGSGSLKLITRFRFDDTFAGDTTYQLMIDDGVNSLTYVLKSSPSRGAVYADPGSHVPGLPRDIVLEVPSGGGSYRIKLDAPSEGVVHINPVFFSDNTWSWYPELSLSVAYDNNLCSYSDDDLDLFVDQLEPDRFRIETYDDLVFLPSLEFKVGYGRSAFRSGLDARYRANLYTGNSIKNYQTLRLEFNQRLFDFSSVSLGYSYLPSFYIRDIKDFDLPADAENRYRKMEFERRAGWLDVSVPATDRLEFSGGYERRVYDYCDSFNEYDGVADSYKAQAEIDLWDYRPSFEYTFRTYDARGYDEPGETKQGSDDSDASYEQDQYQITLGLPGFRVHRVEGDLTLGFRFADRYYTSKKPFEDDPYHSGREDALTKGWVTMRAGITDRIELSVETARYDRRVESRAREEIDEEKDYEKYRVTFEVEYRP
jgi:hypothetical protein